MKLCLATTRDLNTAIISKDECQRRDLARRVLTLCDVLLVLLPAQVVGLYFAIKKSFRFLLSTETKLNSTININQIFVGGAHCHFIAATAMDERDRQVAPLALVFMARRILRRFCTRNNDSSTFESSPKNQRTGYALVTHVQKITRPNVGTAWA
jgi:hypothetical protein